MDAVGQGVDNGEGESEVNVPGFSKVYRVEHQFRETLGIIQADHLYVRQLAEAAFLIAARDPATKTEYILSTSRAPSVPRAFTNLGRCVQVAVRLSGLKTIHFELLTDVSSATTSE